MNLEIDRKSILSATACLALVLVSATALAAEAPSSPAPPAPPAAPAGHHGDVPHPPHPAPHAPHAGAMHGIGARLHALDLTAEQREALHETLSDARSGELRHTMQLLHEAHAAVEALTMDVDASDADIRAAVAEATGAAEAAALARARLAREIYRSLTPEQQAAWDAFEPGTGDVSHAPRPMRRRGRS